jgi:pSer/pThr/pTyr-binding forkhead associated (FHA) protein
MKLQLKITLPDGGTRPFEHSGAVVRIGRDPASELSFDGDAGRAVSWQHARIDLTTGGATLTDAGSSNGTLLNDQRIDRPVPLRVGDTVQLGHTGATLTIKQLDLTTPAPVQVSTWLSIPKAGHVAGAVAAGVLVAVFVFLLVRKGTEKPVEDKTSAEISPGNGKGKPDPGESPEPNQDDKGKTPTPPAPIPLVVAPPIDPSEVRDVGRYVALDRWGPGVLLQRQGEAYPWTALRRESKVATATTLVSLPDYRSTLELDSGVRLTLWGDIPEFSPFPPVLECVVMLNVPDAGIDLDMTLERGRVHLANTKPSGACRVQLRFLRQAWQLTLPAPGKEACLELWPLLGQATGTSMQEVAPLVVGLFIKGTAQLQVAGQTLELQDRSRVSWVSAGGATLDRTVLKELPACWQKPPDRDQPRIADAMLTLRDWSNHLDQSSEVVDTILTRIRESKDPTLRVIGLLFLAALEEIPLLVDFLEDRQHSEVRGAARHALQVWLSRRPDSQAELARILKDKRYAQEKAALIGHLLCKIPDTALKSPNTYQNLIGYLDHENLIVRDLAFWHLAQLVPEGAAKIAYDPLAEADQRKKTIDQWRKLVPPGTVPRIVEK